MQFKVEDVSGVKKVLHVEIPEDTVVRELDNAYKQLKKTAKVKGFRPGKTPRSVLERMFKKDVHNDVSSKLLQDSFMEALKETDLNIVGNPEIDPPQLDEKGPYKYDATVEIKPDIDNIDFKGLALKKALYQVTDEEMDAQLQMLQKNLAQQIPATDDRGVEENDFVLIDFEGFENGKPFSETQKTENFTMKIGAGAISKTLDEILIGKKPGEDIEITINFPEDHFNEKLANHEITFHVKLHEIREEVLPEIDDEFAKKLGQYETLGEVKNAITENLKQGYEKRVEQELNEQIFQELIEKTEFELPPSMIEYELNGIIDEVEKTLSYYNKSMEDEGFTRESLAEKHLDTAEKKVRRHLILDKIIDQEELTLSDKELDAGFSEMAQAVNQPVEAIKSYYNQNQSNLDFFKHTLLEKQAIKLIIDSSTLEEIEPKLEKNTES
ncbi:MAG: trigger factor [Deltaproteobacteria bacterium]|nr:trigger factor [Deltaproteobacteria bacterium]MBW1969556.1 trigger factor [Deltaproteobacteria bacterium]MBW2157505.1 trigger factor [Deltaproteobacteria bacterium]MBW2197895.1 trigger factor [Deltaproteobacteria bacterium]MBW2227620.1 trigger factor [Deltaproteobacteria bacterium]